MADIQTQNAPAPALGRLQQLLWVLRAADMTSVADQALTKVFSGTLWLPMNPVANRVSGGFSVACLGGMYTAAAKTGNIVVAAAQSFAGLTGALTTVLPVLALTGVQNSATLFLSLTTGNTGALNADIFIFGTVLD